jgi:hypothetical protein
LSGRRAGHKNFQFAPWELGALAPPRGGGDNLPDTGGCRSEVKGTRSPTLTRPQPGPLVVVDAIYEGAFDLPGDE